MRVIRRWLLVDPVKDLEHGREVDPVKHSEGTMGGEGWEARSQHLEEARQRVEEWGVPTK